MAHDYRIQIASVPDREKLIAEIYFHRYQLAEINQEGAALQIEIYSHPSGKEWRLDFTEMMTMLEEARRELLN